MEGGDEEERIGPRHAAGGGSERGGEAHGMERPQETQSLQPLGGGENMHGEGESEAEDEDDVNEKEDGGEEEDDEDDEDDDYDFEEDEDEDDWNPPVRPDSTSLGSTEALAELPPDYREKQLLFLDDVPPEQRATYAEFLQSLSRPFAGVSGMESPLSSLDGIDDPDWDGNAGDGDGMEEGDWEQEGFDPVEAEEAYDLLRDQDNSFGPGMPDAPFPGSSSNLGFPAPFDAPSPLRFSSPQQARGGTPTAFEGRRLGDSTPTLSGLGQSVNVPPHVRQPQASTRRIAAASQEKIPLLFMTKDQRDHLSLQFTAFNQLMMQCVLLAGQHVATARRKSQAAPAGADPQQPQEDDQDDPDAVYSKAKTLLHRSLHLRDLSRGRIDAYKWMPQGDCDKAHKQVERMIGKHESLRNRGEPTPQAHSPSSTQSPSRATAGGKPTPPSELAAASTLTRLRHLETLVLNSKKRNTTGQTSQQSSAESAPSSYQWPAAEPHLPPSLALPRPSDLSAMITVVSVRQRWTRRATAGLEQASLIHGPWTMRAFAAASFVEEYGHFLRQGVASQPRHDMAAADTAHLEGNVPPLVLTNFLHLIRDETDAIAAGGRSAVVLEELRRILKPSMFSHTMLDAGESIIAAAETLIEEEVQGRNSANRSGGGTHSSGDGSEAATQGQSFQLLEVDDGDDESSDSEHPQGNPSWTPNPPASAASAATATWRASRDQRDEHGGNRHKRGSDHPEEKRTQVGGGDEEDDGEKDEEEDEDADRDHDDGGYDSSSDSGVEDVTPHKPPTSATSEAVLRSGLNPLLLDTLSRNQHTPSARAIQWLLRSVEWSHARIRPMLLAPMVECASRGHDTDVFPLFMDLLPNGLSPSEWNAIGWRSIAQFSPTEDRLLAFLLMRYGGSDYDEISQKMPRRSSDQIGHRFKNRCNKLRKRRSELAAAPPSDSAKPITTPSGWVWNGSKERPKAGKSLVEARTVIELSLFDWLCEEAVILREAVEEWGKNWRDIGAVFLPHRGPTMTSTFWRTMLQQPHGLKKKAEANEALLRRITKERDEAGFFRAMVAGNSRMLSSQGAVLTCEHRDMNNRKCEQKFPSLQATLGQHVRIGIGTATEDGGIWASSFMLREQPRTQLDFAKVVPPEQPPVINSDLRDGGMIPGPSTFGSRGLGPVPMRPGMTGPPWPRHTRPPPSTYSFGPSRVMPSTVPAPVPYMAVPRPFHSGRPPTYIRPSTTFEYTPSGLRSGRGFIGAGTTRNLLPPTTASMPLRASTPTAAARGRPGHPPSRPALSPSASSPSPSLLQPYKRQRVADPFAPRPTAAAPQGLARVSNPQNTRFAAHSAPLNRGAASTNSSWVPRPPAMGTHSAAAFSSAGSAWPPHTQASAGSYSGNRSTTGPSSGPPMTQAQEVAPAGTAASAVLSPPNTSALPLQRPLHHGNGGAPPVSSRPAAPAAAPSASLWTSQPSMSSPFGFSQSPSSAAAPTTGASSAPSYSSFARHATSPPPTAPPHSAALSPSSAQPATPPAAALSPSRIALAPAAATLSAAVPQWTFEKDKAILLQLKLPNPSWEDLASQFQVRTSDVVKRSKELIAMMMSKRG